MGSVTEQGIALIRHLKQSVIPPSARSLPDGARVAESSTIPDEPPTKTGTGIAPRSPMIPLRAALTLTVRADRDRAWKAYAKLLNDAGQTADAAKILDTLDMIWEFENPPPVLPDPVAHPSRPYVEGEYKPPAAPACWECADFGKENCVDHGDRQRMLSPSVRAALTTVEQEEEFMSIVDTLNALVRQKVLIKYSVEHITSTAFEDGWRWCVTAYLGTGQSGSTLTRFLSTRQVANVIDQLRADRDTNALVMEGNGKETPCN